MDGKDLTRNTPAVNQLRWSPDGTTLAIGCQDGTVVFHPVLQPPALPLYA